MVAPAQKLAAALVHAGQFRLPHSGSHLRLATRARVDGGLVVDDSPGACAPIQALSQRLPLALGHARKRVDGGLVVDGLAVAAKREAFQSGAAGQEARDARAAVLADEAGRLQPQLLRMSNRTQSLQSAARSRAP
jgi:hypothetical protein